MVKLFFFILFLLFLPGCVSTTAPSDYGISNELTKFEGLLMLKPSNIESFHRQTKITLATPFTNENTLKFKYDEYISVQETENSYLFSTNSEFFKYTCEIFKYNYASITKNFNRFDVRGAFNSLKIKDQYSFDTLLDYIPRSSDQVCSSFVRYVKDEDFIYLKRVKNLEKYLALNTGLRPFEDLKIVKSESLGLMSVNGRNNLVNGAMLSYIYPSESNNIKLEQFSSGFFMRDIDTGLPSKEHYKISLLLNDLPFVIVYFEIDSFY